MNHFINIITNEFKDDDSVIESIIESTSDSICESQEQYYIYETIDGNEMITVQLDRNLTNEEANNVAAYIAEQMFNEGYKLFDIEISGEEE